MDKKTQALLAYIWTRRGQAVRNDIIRDLGWSRSTVIGAVDGLRRRGLVREAGMSKGVKGRQPKALRVSGRYGYGIGISVTRGQADLCVVDAGLETLAADGVAGLPPDGAAQLARLREAVAALLARHRLARDRCRGIGVTLPGMIEHRRGMVRRSACFEGGARAPIVPFWEQALGVPCTILEHTAALALTEKEWGAARDLETFLYFDGGGVGMFLDGRLFMGRQRYGGEIGMMKVGDGPGAEVDGRTGTLNQLTRFRDLRHRIETALGDGTETLLAGWLKDGRVLSRELVAEAAAQGDVLCRGLVEETFRVYAEVLVGLNYLFNPEAIFLWPWTARCPDITLDVVRRRLALCKLANPDLLAEVKPARLGPESLARGMAILPLNRFFEAVDRKAHKQEATP